MIKKSVLSGLCKSVTAVYLGSLPLLAFSQEQNAAEPKEQEFNTFQELKESYDSKLNVTLEDNLLTFEEINSLNEFLTTNIDKVKTPEEQIPGLGPIAKKYPGLIDDKAKLMYPSDKLLSEEDTAKVKKLLSYYTDEEFNEFKNKEQLTLQDFVLIYRLIENKPEILTIKDILAHHAYIYDEVSDTVKELSELEKKVKDYTNAGAKIIIGEVGPLRRLYISERETLLELLKTYSNKEVKMPLLEEVFPEVNKTGKKGESVPLFLLYIVLPSIIHLMAKAYKREFKGDVGLFFLGNVGLNGFLGTLFLDHLHPSVFWIRNSLPILYEAAKRKKKE